MSYGDDTTVIARTVARITLPLILVTAFSLLLQGHNLPGGGFIAGVLTAAAFALVYIVFGMEYVQETVFGLDHDPGETPAGPGVVEYYRSLFAVGLAIAAGGGLAAMLFDVPFLTQTDDTVTPDDLGGGPVAELVFGTLFDIHWATAFVFDVGVYLVVVGGLLTILAVVGSE
ncbi:MnhB domain-containing protein [Haloarchaeobius sp. HRN-SO-5]|uniref:MnhB domain-containing protein n=1 Tax=Haloarchaeobius sp. HRN-SO-5 TaxID=3446118 RepID=UPI003EC06198